MHQQREKTILGIADSIECIFKVSITTTLITAESCPWDGAVISKNLINCLHVSGSMEITNTTYYKPVYYKPLSVEPSERIFQKLTNSIFLSTFSWKKYSHFHMFQYT